MPAPIERSLRPKEDERPGRIDLLLARPLFAADRHPPRQPETAIPVLPRVSGIIITPGSAVAMLQMADASTVIVRAGSLSGEWTVLRITRSDVTLAAGPHVAVVQPSFASPGADRSAAVATTFWHVGLRRNEPVGSYLQRRAVR